MSGPQMSNEGTGIRLGDLLTKAGLLQAAELREAMQIAKHQSLPVGRVLIMSGYVSDSQLRCAVQAQSLLKDGLVDLDTVVRALTLLSSEDIPLEEAFKRIGVEVAPSQPTNKLGELLIEAELITREQLDAALQQCNQSGLPLGRILLLTGIVADSLLSAALNAQVLVRDKKLTREQAIAGLRAARDRQISLEQSLAEHGLNLPMAPTVRLGELLVMAGLVPEANLMDCVELGLIKEQPIGQIFLSQGLITEQILADALEVQRAVSQGQLDIAQCGQFLAHVVAQGGSVAELLPSSAPAPQQQAVEVVPLYQLLQLAGRLTPQQIENAVKAGTRDAQIMGLMLRNTGAIDDFLLSVSLGCLDFMASGMLNVEQSLVAINHCLTHHVPLEDAFQQLGWYLNQPYSKFTNQSAHSDGKAAAAHQASQAAVAPPAVAQTQPPYRQGTATLELSEPVSAQLSDSIAQQSAAPEQEAPSDIPGQALPQSGALPPPPGYTPLSHVLAQRLSNQNQAAQSQAGEQAAAPAATQAAPQGAIDGDQGAQAQAETQSQTKSQIQPQVEAEGESQTQAEQNEDAQDKPRKRLIDLVP
ncbi:MAG TPA: hypothetical protein V6D17_24490 [Candidatus Obscuribacterales bacterium]